MKRPIVVATLGFIIGIIGGLYRIIAPFIFMFLSGAIFIQYKKYTYHPIRFFKKLITIKGIILCGVFILIGFIHIFYLEKDYETIYQKLNHITVEGIIVTEKSEKKYNDEYVIRVHKINEKKVKRRKFLLRVDKQEKEIAYGDCISLKVSYVPPEKQRNDYGFSQEQYWKTQRIYGVLKKEGNATILSKNNIFMITFILQKVKSKIVKGVEKNYSTKTKDIYLGLLLGDQKGISSDIKENFADTGLSHLLAVSGTHISYIVIGIQFALRKVPISKKKQNGIICILLLSYLGVIHFLISATRAVIMTILVLLSHSYYRKQDIATSISISSFLILVYNPYQIMSAGFLLSFLGTISIIAFLQQYPQEKSKFWTKVKEIARAYFSVQILIFPLLLIYFHKLSPIGFIANIIISFLIAPIILLGLVSIVMMFLNQSIFSFLSFFLLSICIRFINYPNRKVSKITIC